VEHLSGGEMLIRALADEGVEFLFGYPGVQYCTFTTPFFSKTKSSTFWCVMSKRLVMRLTVMRALLAKSAVCWLPLVLAQQTR